MADSDPSAVPDRDLDQMTELQRAILRSLDEAGRDGAGGASGSSADGLSGSEQSRGADGGMAGGTAVGGGPGLSTDGRS